MGIPIALSSAMYRVTTPLVAFSLALATACSSPAAYQDDWGSEDLAGGKIDGLADLAHAIALSETVVGEVDSQSMVLYTISLLHGDELTMTMNVTGGDLSPHFTLFQGVSNSVSSTDFNVTSDSLTKTFKVDESGTHFIAVRAFRGNGAGSYDFSVECDGGPCAGDFSGGVLKDFEADECLEKAQACAFEDMQVFNGAVGPVRARNLVEGCMNNLATDDGISCASTCVTDSGRDTGADDVCNWLIEKLPFFADQSDTCIRNLDSCMSDCTDLSDGGFRFDSEDEIGEEPFSRCFAFGLNSDCVSYAVQTEACGGDLESDTVEECEAHCEATSGAWADDLSSACPSDACDFF